MMTRDELDRAAERLAALLQQQQQNIVLAESCTGGLVSAVLTRIPGISQHHCGSAVVYQVLTKHHWLGISETLLNDPGPVSAEVARAMGRRVLEKTPQADLSAAVTGHLGPDAPSAQDGLLYIAVAVRQHRGRSGAGECFEVLVKRHELNSEAEVESEIEPEAEAAPDDGSDDAASPMQKRMRRQQAAAALVLRTVADVLDGRLPLNSR